MSQQLSNKLFECVLSLAKLLDCLSTLHLRISQTPKAASYVNIDSIETNKIPSHLTHIKCTIFSVICMLLDVIRVTYHERDIIFLSQPVYRILGLYPLFSRQCSYFLALQVFTLRNKTVIIFSFHFSPH